MLSSSSLRPPTKLYSQTFTQTLILDLLGAKTVRNKHSLFTSYSYSILLQHPKLNEAVRSFYEKE